MTTRRRFLINTGLAGAASAAATLPRLGTANDAHPASPVPGRPSGAPAQVARDEAYWKLVATQYQVSDRVTNLEAGFFGMMATPVLEAHRRHMDRANRESSFFARREYAPMLQRARERVASFVGAKPTEIMLTRGATESLQALIGQYNRVSAGDVVMYADLDYGAMQLAMNALAARQGATVVTLDIPEPATRAGVLVAYETALARNPRTRLLLLTHCNNKTGLITPTREIAAMARARGADVIVDAAHSFGQVPLTMDDIGGDFVGFNLHKWIGAPVGAGAFFIREARFDAIDRAHGDETPLNRIDGRIHTGTTNFATVMTIPDAIDFQETIGIPNKSARLRFLRDRWVQAVRNFPGVDVLAPDDPDLVCAITSFRLRGNGTRAANIALADSLLNEFGLFTAQRSGLARGDCVRVTPSLYNSPQDLDRLVAAIRSLATRG